MHAKAAGLYMICTISKHKAEKKGYADAMMLDWQGRVAECTGANIFFIKDGVIHTPIADCFLNGITRQTVIEIAKQQGMEVVERRIMPDELSSFNECFIVGSAAEVTPVSEIAQWRFTPGNMSRAWCRPTPTRCGRRRRRTLTQRRVCATSTRPQVPMRQVRVSQGGDPP